MMRTTLTIDDDIAASLKKEQRRCRLTQKELIHLLLRKGLAALHSTPSPPTKLKLTRFGKGGSYFENLDKIADVLAVTEGESYK